MESTLLKAKVPLTKKGTVIRQEEVCYREQNIVLHMQFALNVYTEIKNDALCIYNMKLILN